MEAVGNDYSDYGRISAGTGLPTILGWKGHELQWRGSTKLFDGREEEVADIYQSEDPDRVRQLLEQYGIRYVYFGRREQTTYGDNHLSDYAGFLRTVFQQGGVTIYERLNETERGTLPPTKAKVGPA